MYLDGDFDRHEYKLLRGKVTQEFADEVVSNTAKGSYPVLTSIFRFVVENWEEIFRVILFIALRDGRK